MSSKSEDLRYIGRHLTGRPFLLIGQAPARSAELDTRPWDSASGRLLAKRMGISLGELLETHDTINLNPTLLGTQGKWDTFDAWTARRISGNLIAFLWGWEHRYDAILCAGTRVAEHMNAPILGWRKTSYASRVGGIPHPGGTNMWWNDGRNRSLAEAYLADYGRRVAAGRWAA